LGKSQEITPARIDSKTEETIKDIASRIYKILRMEGFSRSEFIIVDGTPFLLEVNTVPGLTNESILPQQAKEAQISLPDLFDNAIILALQKHNNK
jgi:D-alanine-D-alanine ligase